MAVEPSLQKKKQIQLLEAMKRRKQAEYTAKFRCPLGGFHVEGEDGETCGKCGEVVRYV